MTGTSRVRTRKWSDVYKYVYRNYPASYGHDDVFNVTSSYTFQNSEIISDSNNAEYLHFVGSDYGGPMTLNKSVALVRPAYLNYRTNDGKFGKGDVVAFYINGAIDQSGDLVSNPSDVNLIGLGTKAIARTTPTSPSYSLSNTLGEFRTDGLPSLVGMSTLKETTSHLRSSGEEYLNVEFAWRPLISDLRSFARSVKGSNKVIKQYLKGSDTKIRRRYSFPSEDATQLFSTGVNGVGNVFTSDGSWHPGTLTHRSYNRTWFSGAFRYHIPLGSDMPSKLMRFESEANKLLGLRLTPKVVWDLAPWSWAYDWFGNVGSIMANISNLGSDGTVLQYGYIMNEHVNSFLYSCSWSEPYTGRTLAANTELLTKSARRRGATPYGFDFDMSALSARQSAIVAALGLVQVHK